MSKHLKKEAEKLAETYPANYFDGYRYQYVGAKNTSYPQGFCFVAAMMARMGLPIPQNGIPISHCLITDTKVTEWLEWVCFYEQCQTWGECKYEADKRIAEIEFLSKFLGWNVAKHIIRFLYLFEYPDPS